MNISIEQMSQIHLSQIDLKEFDDFWNINMLKQELSLENSFYIIAKCDNVIVGFAGINIIVDEAHLANIVVRKDKRNLKIGSLLLEALINKAKESAFLITLEVNVKNLAAIHLYEKYGFKTLGRRKKYYNNQFDAFIMTKYF